MQVVTTHVEEPASDEYNDHVLEIIGERHVAERICDAIDRFGLEVHDALREAKAYGSECFSIVTGHIARTDNKAA